MKSEPSVYSIDSLMKKPHQTDNWDGVRNYQARRFLGEMKKGDLAFFYHSSCEDKGIVGIMEIVAEKTWDETAQDKHSPYYDAKRAQSAPFWYKVKVRGLEKFKSVISLARLKTEASLKNLILLKPGNRLSVMPISPIEWKTILKLSKETHYDAR